MIIVNKNYLFNHPIILLSFISYLKIFQKYRQTFFINVFKSICRFLIISNGIIQASPTSTGKVNDVGDDPLGFILLIYHNDLLKNIFRMIVNINLRKNKKDRHSSISNVYLQITVCLSHTNFLYKILKLAMLAMPDPLGLLPIS